MPRLQLVIAFAPLACISPALVAQEKLEQNGQIPILAWMGPPQAQTTVERYQELANAGFTHNFRGFSDATAMASALDVAQKTGLKLLISCPELAKDPQGAAKRFKDHPAFGGYYLRDEPSAQDFAGLAQWIKKIREVDEQSLCYINLFPNYATAEQLKAASYQEYVDRFVREVPVPVISFDHYPIVGNDVRPNWYANLEIISRAARDAHKPFWAFALSVKHYGYPEPTLSHLRLQVFSNLAYGASAIQYFTYWSPGREFSVAPIGPDGKRTVVYERIQQVNREVRALSPVFLGGEVLAVGHAGANRPAGTVPYKPASPISNIKATGAGALVSTLRNGDRQFLVVVNKDPAREIDLEIALAGSAKIQRVAKDATLRPVGGENLTERVAPGDAVILTWRK